jgi:hypothetical protein
MAPQNNSDVPGVARVRVTASFRYSDTLIARGIDVRNWHFSDDLKGKSKSALPPTSDVDLYGEILVDLKCKQQLYCWQRTVQSG